MTHETAPLVAIVILTWNQRDLTLDCLTSLAGMDYPTDRLHLIVVDNGSNDGTPWAIRERFPHVTVLETGDNLGYAGGNNVGIRYALEQGTEYVCILNNDVVVAPENLASLASVLRAGTDIGVTTPLVVEMANQQRVWALGVAVNWHTGVVDRLHTGELVEDWRRYSPFEVDVASGAAMLVKREVFERVGLLDEAFFLYYEEVDWCLRVHQAGYCIMAVPDAVVWHKGSGTLGTSSPVIDYYMLRNHLRLVNQHWSGPQRWQRLARTVFRDLLTIAAYTFKSQGGARIPHRNARLLALRDAVLGRWGKMGPDVAKVCYPSR